MGIFLFSFAKAFDPVIVWQCRSKLKNLEYVDIVIVILSKCISNMVTTYNIFPRLITWLCIYYIYTDKLLYIASYLGVIDYVNWVI